MYICTKCKLEKSVEKFAKNKRKRSGLQPWCKDCMSAYDKIRYKTYWKVQVSEGNSRRRELYRQRIWDFLLKNPCIDCGEDNPIVLQFDHVLGDKIESVSHMATQLFKWESVEKEIAKCVIRCANCHTKRTAQVFGWYKNQI